MKPIKIVVLFVIEKCPLKLPLTLRNIDWLYTTSICPPVYADQNFKLDEAGLAIVYYHKSPFCMMRLLSTQI